MAYHTIAAGNPISAGQEHIFRWHLARIMSGVRLPWKERALLEADVRRAVCYYLMETQLSVEEAFERIGPGIFGSFYAPANPDEWYPLDSAAKVYPLSMTRSRMSIFRIAANMDEKVVPEILQLALLSVMKRFPTFATTLKRGIFWHYLDARRKRFVAEKEYSIPCAPIKLNTIKDQVFRLTYFNNRIALEVFHCVTDGYGGMVFLRTLLAEYLSLLGQPTDVSDGIFDLAESPAKEELADAFPLTAPSDKSTGYGNGRAIQIKGKRAAVQPAQVLHFSMPAVEIGAAAKRFGTSVTVFVLSSMFLAAKASCRETKGAFRIQLPVNMRQYYPVRTLRNFSMYAIISIPFGEVGTLGDLIPKVAEQVKEKTSVELLDGMAASTMKLVRHPWLRHTPLSLKGLIISKITNNLTRRSFTAVLSNLGVEKQCFHSHVKSFEAIPGPSNSNQVGCGIISYGDTTVFSITKPTMDHSFESELYNIFSSAGIDVEVGGNNPGTNADL